MAWSLDGHNSTGQVLSIHVLGGACVCRGHGGSYSALFPHPPPDIKANSDSGGLWHRGPLSTQETKHGAASLHRIKQSLNASSCYTLPNETFMKGPLMWFQKHLVISPRAAEWRSVDVWMNGLLLKNDSMSGGAYGFIDQHVPHRYCPLFHSL